MKAFSRSCLTIASLLCAGVCAAVIEHVQVEYPHNVRTIHGRVTGYGRINPGAQIQVYDNAQVWFDHSLSMEERRQKQTKVADGETDERGRFSVGFLPEGFYEVEFRRAGWDVLSVFVHIKPNSAKDKLCVELRIESSAGKDSAKQCH